MSTLIDYLKRFNRKERFILLSHAMGQKAFRLDPEFQRKLEDKIGIAIRNDAFVAMDYHLDWLQMALYLADKGGSLSRVIKNRSHIEGKPLIRANQEDIDLLIAFNGRDQTHLVLIEAKADTGWTNKQVASKEERLSLILDGRSDVKPHYILMSPRKSDQLNADRWHWLELPLDKGLLKVTRCDENKKPSKTGESLFIREYIKDGDEDGRWEVPTD